MKKGTVSILITLAGITGIAILVNKLYKKSEQARLTEISRQEYEKRQQRFIPAEGGFIMPEGYID